MGHIVVEGEKNPNIYSGKLKDEAFKEANPQKPQPVPYEIDSHKEWIWDILIMNILMRVPVQQENRLEKYEQY